MSHDPNGQFHAGSIGLFDDPEEIAYSEARVAAQQALADSKARNRKEKQRRRGDERKNRLRMYEKPGLMQRMSNLFGPGKEGKREEGVMDFLIEEEDERVYGEIMDGGFEDKDAVETYGEWEVDTDVDSPFYEELGLVRIKAGNARDVKVVHRSQVRSLKTLVECDE
jgi:hypothetical protein